MRIFLFIIGCLVGYHQGWAQVGLSSRAMNQFEKGNYEKAFELVDKALEKDSALSAPYYTKSYFLFKTDSQYNHVDSAYAYVLKSERIFPLMEEDEREKHIKANIDSSHIAILKGGIDSLAYSRAAVLNTEESFIYFISHFLGARQTVEAIKNRNQIAFNKAREINSYESYKQFMNTYPDAIQVPEASRRYERLFYDISTKDGHLESYVSFLEKNPDTPYRKDAENNIYEIVTADNSPESYFSFIQRFNKSGLRNKAIAFLYHILKERGDELPSSLMNDSLKYTHKLEDKVLFPIRENGKYGFMDADGELILSPLLEDLGPEMLCGGIISGVYAGQDQLFGLNNRSIYQGAFDSWADLGMGLLKVEKDNKYGLVQKGGFKVLPISFPQIRILNGEFILYKKGQFWGLSTFSGRMITKPLFTDIVRYGPFYVFENGTKYSVKNRSQLLGVANNVPTYFDMKYDDYDVINDKYIWLYNGDDEAVLNEKLEEIIPFNGYKIKALDKGYLIEEQAKSYLLNEAFRPIDKEPAERAVVNKKWVGLYHSGLWSLYDINNERIAGHDQDSLRLLGNNFAAVYHKDSLVLHTAGTSVLLKSTNQLSLIAAVDSLEYVLVDNGRSKSILNAEGKEIYSGSFNEVKTVGGNMLIVSKNNKGLISSTGESLLPFVYEAIGNYNNGYLSLLRNQKFGLYGKDKKLLIHAQYDKNIKPYNQELFVVERNDGYGFITKENKRLSEFGYEKVQFWSDSVAIVKKDFNWLLYNIYIDKVVDENIKSIHIVSKDSVETVAIFLKETGYGVYSSVRGEVVPPTFNDIINVGTKAKPVYFTEKHIEEAEYYIVIYYNSKGELIYKQVYEDDEYVKIYCDN
ncbi:WG repeat-containing protein [Fulvivirga ligni]|uniref:WG repeat-containing protein n=1 Tax=Fulvivirga ligni TaxID=2904246 RepID=UPI001F469906|nr:WG repeat-containing protein [Fulvivirga ligni]UII21326.1 WG repeat-containing protein [Fulvivirga ligni]